MYYLQRRPDALPFGELASKNTLAPAAPLNPAQIAAIAVLPKFNIHLKILFEVPLLLLAERRHLLQLDHGGPVDFGLLLLTAYEGSIEDVADKKIFANSLGLLEFEGDIPCEDMLLREDNDMLLILFNM